MYQLEDYKKIKSEELETASSEKEMLKTEMNRLEEKLKQFQEDINNKNSLIETLVNLLA